jgi:hypothetical protein
MLIPFLDILCSLIGVLVLIIVVLAVAQTKKANGRTRDQLQIAEEFVALQKKQKDNDRVSDELAEKIEALEKLKKDLAEKEDRVAKLRKILGSATDLKSANQNLLKELDNLMVELGGLGAQEPQLKKDIAALQAELAKRKSPIKQEASVVINPAGSGLAQGTKVFFVEASAGRLTMFWDEKTKTVVSAAPDVIATDVAFNAFLKSVAAVPQSRIFFLLRDDGMGAYNLGAGWALATYGFKVEQLGKLPVPGRGEIDLRMFKGFTGAVPPPPEAKIIGQPAPPQAAPPKPATPPPAPPK